MPKTKIYNKEVHFKINKDIWDLIQKKSQKEKITPSELLRKIIYKYLNKEE